MKDEVMQYIYTWPDYFWCYKEEYEEVISGKSDDFIVCAFPADFTYEQIDALVKTAVDKGLHKMPE